jgi:hypothetical protein
MAGNNAGMNLDGNYLQRVPGGADLQQVIGVLNDVVNVLNNQLQQQIFSDGTNKRMIIGYQPSGWGAGKDFGIKVSAPGYDVTTATDAQLLFKMDLQTWYFYDPKTSKNFMQFGILPDGTGGWVVAETGHDVSEGF